MYYDHDEITLPNGHSVEDLAWMGFCWDMQILGYGSQVVTRTLLVPGRMVSWKEPILGLSLSENLMGVDVSRLVPGYDNMVSLAQSETDWLANQGLEIVTPPFLVNFSVPEFGQYSSETSLGELVSRGGTEVMMSVIKHVRSVRPAAPLE